MSSEEWLVPRRERLIVAFYSITCQAWRESGTKVIQRSLWSSGEAYHTCMNRAYLGLVQNRVDVAFLVRKVPEEDDEEEDDEREQEEEEEEEEENENDDERDGYSE